MTNRSCNHSLLHIKIADEPGYPEEPVELDELYELVGLVVVEVDRFHTHAQAVGLGLYDT